MKTVCALFDDLAAAVQGVEALYAHGAASHGASLLVGREVARDFVQAHGGSPQAQRLEQVMGFGFTPTPEAGPVVAAGPIMQALRKAAHSLDGALQAWGLSDDDRKQALEGLRGGQALVLAAGKVGNAAIMKERLREAGAQWLDERPTPADLFEGSQVVAKSALFGDEDTEYWSEDAGEENMEYRLPGEEDTDYWSDQKKGKGSPRAADGS